MSDEQKATGDQKPISKPVILRAIPSDINVAKGGQANKQTHAVTQNAQQSADQSGKQLNVSKQSNQNTSEKK